MDQAETKYDMASSLVKLNVGIYGSHPARRIVLLDSPQTRSFVRSIVERFRALTTLVSQAEVRPRIKLKTIGSI